MIKQWWLLTLGILLSVACNHQADPSTDSDNEPNGAPLNLAPVAHAGTNVSAFENQNTTLSGIDSNDDSAIVAYQWTQISGLATSITNPKSQSATITTPATPSELVFELTVTDAQGLTNSDQVTIQVEYFYEVAPTIASLPYTAGPRIAHQQADECVSYENNFIHNDTLPALNAVNAGSVAIMWGKHGHLSADTQAFLTTLQDTQSTEHQNVICWNCNAPCNKISNLI